MARWWIPLVLLACHGRNTPAPAPTQDAPSVQVESDIPQDLSEDWAGTEEARTVYQRLVARDGPPPCEEVEAGIDAPVETLGWLAEHVQMPPWVPMHAAHCLVQRHGEEARGSLISWVQAPEKQGLARVVLNELDALPEDVAVEVARAALQGPSPERAQREAAESAHPAVRALVDAE